MKFKVGDKVRITKKISNHGFNIGDIVKIVDTDEQDDLQYYGGKSGEYSKFWFSGLECESITDSYDIHITSNKEKYNGKVICIESKDNPFFTIGGFYNVINGVFIGDCTSEWTNDDKYFYSLEEINDYFKDYDNVKFIKLVED